MIYSATTEYAIRALSHIATLESGERILARDLAKETGVPRQFLGKILHRLARLGFLDSAKGRGGGFRFEMDPGTITVHRVVTAMEGDERLKKCVLGLDDCNDEGKLAGEFRMGRAVGDGEDVDAAAARNDFPREPHFEQWARAASLPVRLLALTATLWTSINGVTESDTLILN